LRPDRLDAVQFALTAVLLIGAIVLGGGQGDRGDFFVQGLALLLLGVVAAKWQSNGNALPPSLGQYASWAILLPLALPLLQLLPMPAELWQSNAMRRELATQLSVAGVPMSSYVSLKPLAAERALWSLLPAVAMYLSVLRLSAARQRQLLALFLAIAAFSVLLGMAQLAGGSDSALRFHHPTNPTEAVGFFANRNHYAILLVMAMPLAICGTAWAITERLAGRSMPATLILGGAGLTVLLILGVALARSRAGLLLGMAAVLLSAPVILSLRRSRGLRRTVSLVLAAGLVLSVQFALFGILERLEKDPFDDVRWAYARTTAQAAEWYAPMGSGLGTFRQVFQPFEAASAAGSQSHFANHAHNDYVELWLEGGWPFAFLLAVAFTGLVSLTLRVWRKREDAASLRGAMSRATWAAVVLALAHSLGDYPLRTTAGMTVFSMMAGMALAYSGRSKHNCRLAAAPLGS
jgi:hypothetical protein